MLNVFYFFECPIHDDWKHETFDLMIGNMKL